MKWVVLDTETSGIRPPVFVLDLAAQRMCDWEPEGPPFRRLINHNQDISPEASRVNGLTREILERDGDPPLQVYQQFSEYVGDLPIVSYNLDFDLNRVLLPEWERLGLTPIGRSGFCALRLAQRLLDPVLAGNHKLQTLRRYYRLPERGAHTALGDVETVIDLMRTVLRPIAEQRGLDSLKQVQAFALEAWFPSRLAFGKFKGRHYREAESDTAFRSWLEWLASSGNSRSARMGQWYLKQLNEGHHKESADTLYESTATGVVLYSSPEITLLRRLIDAARSRLAELEAELTEKQSGVASVQAQLFGLLRQVYERRDQLAIIVRYRRKFLDTLLQEGEDKAAKTTDQYEEARRESEREYSDAEKEYANKKQGLSEDERRELKILWKKLVGLYHPDRYENDLEKRAVYEYLTSEINRAQDQGDMKRLLEIADDPNAFLRRQGKSSLAPYDDDDLLKLRKLYDGLQAQIMAAIEKIEALKNTSEYELYLFSLHDLKWLDKTSQVHAAALEKEIRTLEEEATALALEIEELTGEKAF